MTGTVAVSSRLDLGDIETKGENVTANGGAKIGAEAKQPRVVGSGSRRSGDEGRWK